MAKNMQPVAKRCKALGISPTVMGYSKKETKRNPGGQMRKKKSEYAIQLNEKQKVKFVYGILEKQFRMYYEKASRMQGKAGENLLIANPKFDITKDVVKGLNKRYKIRPEVAEKIKKVEAEKDKAAKK